MAGVLGKFLEYIGIEENGADDEVLSLIHI